ncbi:hypothetical protein ACFVFF_18045 [Streptomyces sp. NPDC057680]|uniref:hypothetical protein n=1 Tax=Streptomyces sp. NPDC057680 TaxID=3346208 RepID=UPI0036C8D037
MPHPEQPSGPTPVHYPVPLHHPTASAPLATVPPTGLPAVQSVQLPDGRIITGYALTPTTPAPAPAARPVPAWAKTTALLAPTVGGGVAAAGIGLSYAAPGLIAMSQALWSAAALIVAAVIAVPVLFRTARRAAASGSGSTTHITQNITATGLFGRATGTINHQ